jgi:hypothetical protein
MGCFIFLYPYNGLVFVIFIVELFLNVMAKRLEKDREYL